jgi:hypothetical protein
VPIRDRNLTYCLMKVKAKNVAVDAAFSDDIRIIQHAECHVHGFGVIYIYYNELVLCKSHACQAFELAWPEGRQGLRFPEGSLDN